MSLALVAAGIILILIALFNAVVRLRSRKDWRLMTMAGAMIFSLVCFFSATGFSLASLSAFPVPLGLMFVICGFVFVVAVNMSTHYIDSYHEKKRALTDHVNLFQQFAYSAPLACFIFQDGKIEFSNQGASAITGYTADELAEMEPAALAYDADGQGTHAYLHNLQKLKDLEITSLETELKLKTKSGDARWGVATFGSAMYKGKPAVVGTILDITQQKESENALQEADERVRMAASASGTVVWDINLLTEESQFLVPEDLRADFAFDDAKGREDILRSIYEPDREGLEAYVLQCIADDIAFEADYRRYSINGEIKWWRLQGKALRNEKNIPVRLNGTARCIHDQKLAEESLRENEARLRLATEIAGIQVWEWDISTNDVLHQEQHTTCGQVTGFEDFLRRIHPDHRDRVEQSVTNSLENEQRYEEEFPLLSDDGDYYWQHSVGQLIYDDQGRPIQMIGAAIDTTERKKKDELIHFQANLLDKIGQSVVVQNTEGLITYFNKAACDAYGISDNAALPLDISEAFPQDHRIINKPEIMKTLMSGEQWAGEVIAVPLNGPSYPIFLSVSPLFKDNGEYDGFIGISADISDYKQMQEAFQESEERLRLALDAANLVVWDLNMNSSAVVHSIPSSINSEEAARFNSLEAILSNFYHEDKDEAMGIIMECMQNSEPFSIEHRFLDINGGVDWWQTTGKFYDDEEGLPIRMIGTSQLITKRKEAEFQLQNRMRQLQAIYDVADAINKAVSLESVYTAAASGIENVIGASKIAILTFSEDGSLHFEYSTGLTDEFRNASLEKCPLRTREKSAEPAFIDNVNETALLKDFLPDLKSEGIEAIAAFPLRNKGKLVGKFIVYFDEALPLTASDHELATRIGNHISLALARANDEQILVARTTELQIVADTIPDSILRIRKDMTIRFANKAVLDTADQPLESLLGEALEKLNHPQYVHKKWRANLEHTLQTGQGVAFEFEFDLDDYGRQYYQALITPETIIDGTVESVLSVLRNITEERRLQQSIIDISARQQRSIGQDLHDELGQLLTGIGFKIAGLQHDLDAMDESCAEQSRDISQLVEQAIKQTRMLAEGLNPVTLEVHGLRAGLEKLAIHTESTFGVACPFECPEDFVVKDEETAVQLYRIGQEAINNAIKHGNPSTIDISITQINGKAELVIKDDGNGFVLAPKQSDGHGLRIMDYRAKVIGAVVKIDSKPNAGTTVKCKFKNNLNGR